MKNMKTTKTTNMNTQEIFISAVEYHFHDETSSVNMDGSIDVYLHSAYIDHMAIFTGYMVLNTYQSGRCNVMLHLTGLKTS